MYVSGKERESEREREGACQREKEREQKSERERKGVCKRKKERARERVWVCVSER